MRIFAVVALLLFQIYPVGSANAQTLFPVEQEWSNENGWHVYKNTQIDSCLGETTTPDGTVFLLGVQGEKNDLVIGFSNDRLAFAKKGEQYKLKLLFDGRQGVDVGFMAPEIGSRKLLIGSYSDAAALRSAVARSNILQVSRGPNRLADIPLKGTSATLKALNECYRSLPVAIAKSKPLDETARSNLAEALRLTKSLVAVMEATGRKADRARLNLSAVAFRRN